MRPVALAFATLAVSALPAVAAVTDPTGDFRPTFSGPQTAEFDVVAADFRFDGTTYSFDATLAGPLPALPTAFYVWGVDRGAGAPLFGAFAPGVLFDAVVVALPDGTGIVSDLVTNTTTPLLASAITRSGASISIAVAATVLPSQGLAVDTYTANLWPRISLANDVSVISDFAPDDSNITVTPVPAALPMLAAALAGLGFASATRRRG